MIKIRSKTDGFRRCGIVHREEATEYPDDFFTSEQLATLQADPELVVDITEEKTEATLAELVEAIGKLDKDNADLWTKSKGPQADALADVVGCPVTAKQRDDAWEEYSKEADK